MANAVHEQEVAPEKERDRPAAAATTAGDSALAPPAEPSARPMAIPGLAVARRAPAAVKAPDETGTGEEGVTGIDPGGGGAPPAAGSAPPSDSSSAGGVGSAGGAGGAGDQDPRVRQAAESLDPSDLHDIDTATFATVSRQQRLTFLTELLGDHIKWVGPLDEAAFERIWDSFGPALPEVVAAHQDVWKAGIERGVDPSNISSADKVRRDFEKDVKQLADDHMQANFRFALKEQQDLGLAPGAPQGGQAAAQQKERLQKAQDTAAQAKALLALQDKMKGIKVGYALSSSPRSAMQAEFASPRTVAVTFDPTDQAQANLPTTDPLDPANKVEHSWKELKPLWDQVAGALSYVSSQDPAVFSAVATDRSALDTLSDGSPQQALAAAGQVLSQLQTNISATQAKLTDGELDWMDLTPIHQQLLSGAAKGRSGTDWSGPFAAGVARDMLGDHETREFWTQLGLGTLTAALFIVAEFATAGWATAALMAGGFALSGGQAAAAWDDYDKLKSAAGSAASSRTQVVDQGQVDAAKVNAIIATVGTVLDVATPALKGVAELRAAARLDAALTERGAAAALEKGFKQGAVAGDDAARLIERGITELGVQQTLSSSGKSAEELLKLVPEDSKAAQRIREAIAAGVTDGADTSQAGAKTAVSAGAATGTAAEQAFPQGKQLPEILRGLVDAVKGKTLSVEIGEKIAQEAIEKLGPADTVKLAGGWKGLSEALGKQSTVGTRLMEWRDAVFEDLQKYVKEELHGDVTRTGTRENFTNDMDISFTGKNASEVREKAMKYLAGRLGVESDPRAIDMIIMGGLFTDPRRMHLYDVLPEGIRDSMAQRQAAKERDLIWNRRLWEATNHEKDMPGMADSIRGQMKEMQIEEFAYKPLSESDRVRLGAELDELHSKLEQAIAANDSQAQKELVIKIADSQALINASEGGGYFSAGGVRRWVSERTAIENPGEAAEFPRLGNADAAPLKPEQLATMMDQLPKIDHSALDLASGDAKRIGAGIRGIGKYGDRLAKVTGEAGFDSKAWQDLAKECADLKRAADSGVKSAELAAKGETLEQTAKRLFDQLTKMSSEAVTQAHNAARLPDIGNAALAVQRATQAHVKLLRASDWVLGNLQSLAFALRTTNTVLQAPAAGAPGE